MIVQRCRAPSCFNAPADGQRFCAKHAKNGAGRDSRHGMRDTKTDAERAFYSSYDWQKCRAGYREQNPLCELHLARNEYRPAQMVDHRVRLRDGGAAFDPANLQALCNPCHNAKRAKERGK